jgi:hypothetical protein
MVSLQKGNPSQLFIYSMKMNIQFILDFGLWKWSALNLGYMDKWPSSMQVLGQDQGVRQGQGLGKGHT